jgi:hypothetical protein
MTSDRHGMAWFQPRYVLLIGRPAPLASVSGPVTSLAAPGNHRAPTPVATESTVQLRREHVPRRQSHLDLCSARIPTQR